MEAFATCVWKQPFAPFALPNSRSPEIHPWNHVCTHAIEIRAGQQTAWAHHRGRQKHWHVERQRGVEFYPLCWWLLVWSPSGVCPKIGDPENPRLYHEYPFKRDYCIPPYSKPIGSCWRGDHVPIDAKTTGHRIEDVVSAFSFWGSGKVEFTNQDSEFIDWLANAAGKLRPWNGCCQKKSKVAGMERRGLSLAEFSVDWGWKPCRTPLPGSHVDEGVAGAQQWQKWIQHHEAGDLLRHVTCLAHDTYMILFISILLLPWKLSLFCYSIMFFIIIIIMTTIIIMIIMYHKLLLHRILMYSHWHCLSPVSACKYQGIFSWCSYVCVWLFCTCWCLRLRPRMSRGLCTCLHGSAGLELILPVRRQQIGI